MQRRSTMAYCCACVAYSRTKALPGCSTEFAVMVWQLRQSQQTIELLTLQMIVLAISNGGSPTLKSRIVSTHAVHGLAIITILIGVMPSLYLWRSLRSQPNIACRRLICAQRGHQSSIETSIHGSCHRTRVIGSESAGHLRRMAKPRRMRICICRPANC